VRIGTGIAASHPAVLGTPATVGSPATVAHATQLGRGVPIARSAKVESAAVVKKPALISSPSMASSPAAKKMQADVAQHIRDLNEKDTIIANQKIIAELTYKAQVISITEQELGVGAIQAAFLAVPVAGQYAGVMTVGGKTTLTYLAGKQVTQTLFENGLDKILESKGAVPSDSNQNIVVRLISPALPYPLQVVLKHEDLVLQKSTN
jgi:hypothetical protein